LFKNPATPIILFPVKSSVPKTTTRLSAIPKLTPIRILLVGKLLLTPPTVKVNKIPIPINIPAKNADRKYFPLPSFKSPILLFAAFVTKSKVSLFLIVKMISPFFNIKFYFLLFSYKFSLVKNFFLILLNKLSHKKLEKSTKKIIFLYL